MMLYTLMGYVSGYVAARLYKTMEGEDWRVLTLMAGLLYPGLFFSIFFVLNLMLWGEASSGAVPFTTLSAILVMWFGISLPLCFLGAYYGFGKPPVELPVR